MADATPTPLLNLDTLTTRPIIRIDGAPYEMRVPEELSIVDYHRLSRQGQRLDGLMSAPTLRPEEEQELATILDKLCHTILEAPEATHAKLGDIHRLAIARTFTPLLRASLEPAGGTVEAVNSPTVDAAQASNGKTETTTGAS
jgi:hypothetical protein